MRTSVDRGTLRSQKRRWKQARRIGSIIISLVVLCLIIAGVIGCGEKSSEEGKLPEIVSFQANPPINEGDPVRYTFEVKNATKIRLIEADDPIKEIDGPSSGIYKGIVTGQAPSAVLTSDNNMFNAVLEASNQQGTVKKAATLSASAVLKENPYQPHYPSGWADRPCPTGCGCVTLVDAQAQGLISCGSGCSGPPQCQGPLNPTTKYCYRIPVQPCDTANGCTCMEPSQALPNYVRCSDNLCAANPDKYCYRPACPTVTTCRCLLDTDVAPCNWQPCQGSSPCNNTGEPAKSCYSCPYGSLCMTPADAANSIWPLDTSNPSACKCSRPDEPTMYCYHFPACDNTTGCACLPDRSINNYCQRKMWQCSDNVCGLSNPTGTAWGPGHCYRCPSNCQCLQDSDPNRIANGYTHPCNSDNRCTCLERPDNDWHCYHKPGQ